MDKDIEVLLSRLLCYGYVPRTDTVVIRLLTDELFRQELERRLDQCGLRLLEHPYASNIAVALKQENEEPVLATQESWLNNNLGLSRDAVALLVIVWGLIILPKRERQIARDQKQDAGQTDFFASDKPIPHGESVVQGVLESSLYADFAEQLGGRARMNMNLGVLSRLGFIQRRNKMILEGPLLDVLLDYSVLAPRFLDGALQSLLRKNPLVADDAQLDPLDIVVQP